MHHKYLSLSLPRLALLLALLLTAASTARAQAPTITGLSPTRNQRSAPRTASVGVSFSQSLQNTAATRGALRVYSQQRGGQLRDGARATATVSGNTLTLAPANSFKPGETLLVTTTAATATGGGTLARGQVHQFTAATGGTGRGTFGGGTNPSVGNGPQSVAVGDVDGDGDLDLLTANYSGNTVSVRLNGGDATGSNTGVFSGGSTVTVGGNPQSVAVGDVDGDGDLDLLTANGFSSIVSVRLNGGDATGSNTGVFSGGSTVFVHITYGVAVGDVDGDGDLDLLATSSYDNTVSVRLNGGDATGSNTGVFSGGSDPAVGGYPISVAVGDVDGDGDLDLLTANAGSNTVSVRLNGGDATGSNTGVFSDGSDPAVGTEPNSVAVGDVDGDGDLDLLTANGVSSTVSVRLNGGDATGSNTGVFSGGSDPVVGSYPFSVALGDVDGDGDLDLLTANGSSTVNVRLNGGDATGSNTGVFSGGSDPALGSEPNSVAVGDVDGDGDLDLLAANPNSNTVSVRLNQPPPTLSSFTPASGPVGQTVTVTGIDLSGASSITVNGVAGTITANTASSLSFTVGAGSTTGLIRVTTASGAGSSSTSFTVVPLTITSLSPTRNQRNAPRTASVGVSFSQSLQNTAATRGALRVYSQQRGGQLRDGARATTTVSGSTLTLAPANSFKPGETLLVSTTVAATATGGGTLARGKVHQFTAATGGTGRGTFGGGSNPAVGTNPISVAVGDVDGDGDLDLLTANQNASGTVSVRLNGGDATGSNTGVFSGGSNPAVGTNPISLAVGDVDGDGDLDLLTANYNSNTVSVRLNGGNATGSNTGVFSGGSDPAVGSSPFSVAVGDVDGDGDLDLLTANNSSFTVSVRLNGGDASGSNTGVFSGGSDPFVGGGTISVAVGDVDGDGDLDLLTANNTTSGTVSVRLNGGDASGSNTGVFSGGSDPAVGGNPYSVAVSDVDGDGDLDLLTANTTSNTVSVRLNGGDASGSNTGVFSGGSNPAVGSNPRSVALGDVDGDGDLDLLAANYGSNTVSVRLNGGDATGSNTGVFLGGSDPAVGSRPNSVAVGDVDGDGDLDLLTANFNSFTVSVRLNQGPPTLSSFTPASGPIGQTVTVTGTDLSGATAVTVNGVAGTITANTASSLSFTVGVGSTTGLISVTTPAGTASSSTSFTVVPLTITGLSPTRNQRSAPRTASVGVTFSQSLQNTAATRGALRVYSQQRGGQLRDGARATTTVSGSTLTLAPASSFKPGETLLVTTTVAATATGGGTLARGKVHQFTAATGGTGRGTFGGGSNPAVGGYTASVAVGDVDGDGDLDLLTANYNISGTVSVRLNGGDATGSNTGVFSNGSDPAVGSRPISVALGDVDGDGDLDLLAVNNTSNTVSVRLNGGGATGSNTGVFSGGSDPAVGGYPVSVAVGDVDGDGDLDLLTANNSGTVSVRLNGGDASGSNTGVFSNGSDPAVGDTPVSVAVGDVDGDGDLDLLAANAGSNTVSVRLNGGDATGSNTGIFSGGSDPAVGSSPFSVAVGDVDGDGDGDLLTTNYTASGTVSVRLNGGDATGSNTGIFSGGSDPAVGGYPRSVTLGDVDGDGDLDLLTANAGSNTVSVRLNGGDATGSNTGVFSNGSDPAVSSTPISMAVGDVDGDGDLDLLTATYTASGTVSVRLNQPPPTISSFTPASGPIGQTVTVSGTDLSGASSVTVNGVAGTITANTASSLTFTVGAGSTTGLIRVTTPFGTGSSSTSFTVIPAPTISGFSPTSGPVGQLVTVTGTNFTGATGLTLNGAAITGFTIVNGTTITFTVPAGSSSGPIAVTTPGGTATSSGSFTFFPPPTISSFSPAAANTGTTVTVTGTNFTGATGLTLNGAAITGFTVVNSTTITFALPAGASSGTLAVTTPGGTATSSGPLAVDNTPPTATLGTPAGSSTGTAPIPFTVLFSEPVTGFGAGGLTITGGSLTGGTVSGSGTSYAFSITPTGSGSVVTVQVAAGAAQDAATNASLASNTVSVTYTGPPPGADLVNTGTLLTVQAGGILSVGAGGLGNQGGTLTNGGTLFVAGPFTNPGTLDLGAGTGTLEVRGDVTNSGTLTPGTSLVTFSGTADQTLTAGGATLYQVLVNKPTAGANTLRLADNLTVSNALSLTTGVLATGSNAQVLLGPSATLSETMAGYVTGTVETTRPVSTAGTAQAFGGLGLRLTPSGATLPGSTRVRRTTGTALTGAGTSVSIKRHFDIVPAVNTGLNVALALTYRDDELNGITEANLALFKSQTGTAGPWARQAGATLDASTNTVSKAGISDFSVWTLGNAANPLPVTLLDFTAQAEGPAAVRLRWATASELNNAGFTVERSPDGVAFAGIGTVAGAGTSAVRHAYSLLDQHLPAGVTVLYYRLRQTDFNGDFTYSPVQAVALAPAGVGSFVVFPTRVAAGHNASYRYAGPAEAGTLTVLNVLGQVLTTVPLDGRATGPVPLAGLAAGTYFLRYTGPAGRFTSRCVVE